MTMQRAQFELIARTILDLPTETGGEVTAAHRTYVAHAFARMLRVTNPKFDKARFLKACGVQS